MSKYKKMEIDLAWVLNRGNLGVKGFEIAIQNEIEKHLPENVCWWQVVDKDIFTDLWKVYAESGDDIIFNLTDYYNDIVKEFNEKIKGELK